MSDHSELYEELPPSVSRSAHLLAGAMAGMAEHTCTFPLDALKTRMQTGDLKLPSFHRLFRQTLRQEGMLRLWRGISSVVLGAGPAHGIYFATYEALKGKDTDPLRSAFAGSMATITADAIMTPFDVIKQRMQLSGTQGLRQTIRSLLRLEGFGALYVSYPTTLLLNVPFHGIQFPTYEALKRFLNPDGSYSPISHIVAGGTAGALAAALTCPIDVLKTTLQTRGLLLPPDQQHQLSGIRQAGGLVLRRDGWRGFWRGIQPRVLAFMPSTAICWSVYEYFKWVLQAK